MGAVSANAEVPNLPFADWTAVRACMAEIMHLARHSGQGFEPLANIKRVFRSRYNLELSETLLGYTKLSEVLQSPQMCDLCSLEMRNSGCSVVPAPLWSTSDVSPSKLKSTSDNFGGLFPQLVTEPQNCTQEQTPWQLSPSRESSVGSGEFFQGLLADLEPEESASQLLPPSKLSDGIDIVSMTKNTFIEHPDAITMQREGARRRTRSVPKNMGSTKNDLETTCHALTYQHQSVAPKEAVKPLSRHKITLEKKGCGLGLDVSCEGEPGAESLLIEDVGPGPVELWNLSHFDEIKVQAGDRILEINGIAGDASAMLHALRVSDTVELTLDLSSQKVQLNGQMNMSSELAASSQLPIPEMPGVLGPPQHFQMVPAAVPQLQVSPELAMSCQVPVPSPQMHMPMQACHVPTPQCGGQVFIHSGPPKIFVHSVPPQFIQ